MKNPVLLFILCILFVACEGPPADSQADTSSRFYVPQPSLLYFNNMRSSQYDKTQQANTRIDVYRHRKWEETTSRPLLIPLIVSNWMQDEAYLFLETNPFERGFMEPLTVRTVGGERQDTSRLVLENRSKEGQLDFATHLQHHLLNNQPLWIQNAQQEWDLLFDNAEDRGLFLLVMKDYQTLHE